MASFRKRLAITLTAATLGTATFAAYAERPGCGPMGAGHAAFGEHGKSPERMKAHFEKRQAEMHDKLKLNANQEAAWNAYIAKIRPSAPAARPDRAQIEKMSAPERMEKMLAFMQEGEKRMAERVAATKEFYAVLTPEQQKIFNEEFPFGKGRRGHRGPH